MHDRSKGTVRVLTFSAAEVSIGFLAAFQGSGGWLSAFINRKLHQHVGVVGGLTTQTLSPIKAQTPQSSYNSKHETSKPQALEVKSCSSPSAPSNIPPRPYEMSLSSAIGSAIISLRVQGPK